MARTPPTTCDESDGHRSRHDRNRSLPVAWLVPSKYAPSSTDSDGVTREAGTNPGPGTVHLSVASALLWSVHRRLRGLFEGNTVGFPFLRQICPSSGPFLYRR